MKNKCVDGLHGNGILTIIFTLIARQVSLSLRS